MRHVNALVKFVVNFIKEFRTKTFLNGQIVEDSVYKLC